MKLWQKLKKGVKAGMLAIKVNNEMNDERVIALINEFKTSEMRKLMTVGQRYYEVDNDINKRKQFKTVNGRKIEITYRANHKLAHPMYKNMVDEKIEYLLSKPYTLKCDNEPYVIQIKEILGKKFSRTLTKLGYEASNKGIGWLHPYIDENGKFKTMVIPTEQCIPVWEDSDHEELNMFIRAYQSYEWRGNDKADIVMVEVHTKEGPSYYKLDDESLVPYVDKNFNEVHDKVGYWNDNEGNECEWGKIPFIPFKNNHIEIPDIKFVKSLIDDYDLTRSEASNFVEDVKNIYWILKGYGKQDASDFMRMLNDDHVINIPDTDEGDGVDTISPNMDITSIIAHYDQLKKDIIEGGQSVMKDTDKLGNAPSGIALAFMYSGLDMKANAFEVEAREGFNQLLYFINQYANISDPCDDLEIVFNRDIKVNESETIANLNASRQNISQDTYLSKFPYVSDVEKEKGLIKKDNEENQPFKDHVPGIDDEYQK